MNVWKDGIKYVIDPASSQKLRDGFLVAAKAWQENTCINFTEIAQEDVVGNVTDYLFVTDKDDCEGCLSYVGKLGGYQPLFLGPGCELFLHAAHEIGHAIGLYHGQNRHDRDKYIEVKWDNIEEKYLDQFVKLTKEQNNNYELPYDYGSIMHYPSSISSDGKPAMVPFDDKYTATMGSPMISFIDLAMVNKHYGCTEYCKTEIKCKHGGFPHPRKCEECICPGGYGGPLCDKLPKDCKEGEELDASPSPNSLRAIVYNQNEKTRGRYATCTYWIKAPKGKKVEIEIETITKSHPSAGCREAGVEVKATSNRKITGYRWKYLP
ncbi:astacin [Ancylostoma duodenale]|uniref:Zinc metalloproteinase n=1 Tax=Ancylostoma duodenale TaxID=51022 RepID=A0A0C2G734_9BILA|nr:astacin [Ancylostoma duodenale]